MSYVPGIFSTGLGKWPCNSSTPGAKATTVLDIQIYCVLVKKHLKGRLGSSG